MSRIQIHQVTCDREGCGKSEAMVTSLFARGYAIPDGWLRVDESPGGRLRLGELKLLHGELCSLDCACAWLEAQRRGDGALPWGR